MSDQAPAAEAPGKRINWLLVALIASLAVNLMVAGAVAARWYVGFGPERYARLTQTQLIPRYFFRDLDRARRLELLSVFKAEDGNIRDGREAVKAQVAEIADALEAEPYDPARVRAAIAGFTAKSEELFATGGGAAMALIDKLTPEERQQLARHLRSRDERRGKPAKDDKPDAP